MKTILFAQNRDYWGTQLIHLPLLNALKREIPDNEIIVLSPLESSHYFEELGFASEVRVYERGVVRVVRMLRELRRLRPDLIVSLRAASEWLNAAIGLSGAKESLGFRTTLSKWLLAHTVEYDIKIYKAVNYMKLLEPLGIHVHPGSYFEELAKQGSLELEADRDYYCLMPGGGTGDFKRWGIENFLALCERVNHRHEQARFIFVLGAAEQEYVAQIGRAPIAERSFILFNESLSNIAQGVMASVVTIANDTGPAHIAQMLAAPFVGIFADYDGDVQRRIGEWFHEHPASRAITGGAFEDIKSIPVDAVEDATLAVLEESSTSARVTSS